MASQVCILHVCDYRVHAVERSWLRTQNISCIRVYHTGMSCMWALHTEYEQLKFALFFFFHKVSLSFQEWARNPMGRVLPPTSSDEGSGGHQKNDRQLTPTEKDPRRLVQD